MLDSGDGKKTRSVFKVVGSLMKPSINLHKHTGAQMFRTAAALHISQEVALPILRRRELTMHLILVVFVLATLLQVAMSDSTALNHVRIRKSLPSGRVPKEFTIVSAKEVSNAKIATQNSSELSVSIARSRRLLTICAVIYASTYVITKRLQDIIPSEIINTLRFLLGALCFSKYLFSFRQNLQVLRIGIELGFWCGMGFMFQAASLRFASASKAALFTSIGVIIPPILDTITSIAMANQICPDPASSTGSKTMWQRLITSPYFAPLLTVIGALIIEWGGIDAPSWADFSLLLPPFCFAMTFRRASQTAVKFPQHTNSITGTMLLTTSVMSAIWAYSTKQLPTSAEQWQKLCDIFRLDWQLSVMLLFLGTVATGWTAICEQHALKVLSAREAVLIYTLEPVFATIFSAVFLGEHIGVNTVVGAGLIILACIIH